MFTFCHYLILTSASFGEPKLLAQRLCLIFFSIHTRWRLHQFAIFLKIFQMAVMYTNTRVSHYIIIIYLYLPTPPRRHFLSISGKIFHFQFSYQQGQGLKRETAKAIKDSHSNARKMLPIPLTFADKNRPPFLGLLC